MQQYPEWENINHDVASSWLYHCTTIPHMFNILSRIPGRGDGSLPRSSPESSIGILGRFDSEDLAMTPTAPGHVRGSVTPDVLPSHQHHCNVDKWRSLDVRCGADRPPTMENGLCAAEPL